ncbi:acetyltransferase, GNAT family [Rhodospirillum centenum SW]|uniref:Acetyltransferase, GNAT family n=1 Tax=Rhodospirillum centenum (strain ATCC 51521 / SW) TaxID=414684 RepID=B6IP90_RHOCS|nr:acetyltransferase, GNAT family [Rhodospirillum centenum SW]
MDCAPLPAPAAQQGPAHRPIGTDRLVLRPLTVDDAEDLFPVFSDGESMRFWSCLPHRAPRETRTMLDGMLARDDGSSRMWAVTLDGGRCLGWTSLYGADGRLVWLGYILAPEARGRGLATEAVAATLRYAFEEWDMHRIEANLDPRNDRSARLLERLGFCREGVRREDFLIGDRYHDTLIYGLLAAEWRQSRVPA